MQGASKREPSRKEARMPTSGTDTIVTSEYHGALVEYAVSSAITSDDFNWGLGMTEVELLEPIDYDAEIAERERTHEPIEDAGGNLANSRFGI